MYHQQEACNLLLFDEIDLPNGVQSTRLFYVPEPSESGGRQPREEDTISLSHAHKSQSRARTADMGHWHAKTADDGHHLQILLLLYVFGNAPWVVRKKWIVGAETITWSVCKSQFVKMFLRRGSES